jgi:branched-chain amino acid transport system substrate-binding protein
LADDGSQNAYSNRENRVSHHRRKGWALVGSALAVVVALAAAPSVASAQDKTVKFGALLALSGPLAASGREIRDGVDLAVEDLNRRGGIRALGGAKVEVVYGDSQAKPDVANSETERLVNREGVLAIVDMYPSATTLAASQMAERLKTPYYATIAVADSVTERGFKYVFQQVPRAADLAKFQADFLAFLEKQGGKKLNRVAIVHEDGDYGQAVAAGAQVALKQQNREIVGTFSYPFRSTDVTTMMSRVKAANPDVVIQASYIGDSILISRTAARLGLKVPFIDGGGKAHESYASGIGATGEGEYVLTLWNSDIPGAEDLNARYKAKTGKNMPSHAALLYQSIVTLAGALEQAGRADRDALRDAMAKLDVGPGPDLILPYERIRFDDKGLISGGGFLMTRLTGGRFVTQFPEKFAPKAPAQ